MKFIKILQMFKNATDEQIKEFIYKNMSEEMLRGLEHDDQSTIKRALKLFGVSEKDANRALEKKDKEG